MPGMVLLLNMTTRSWFLFAMLFRISLNSELPVKWNNCKCCHPQAPAQLDLLSFMIYTLTQSPQQLGEILQAGKGAGRAMVNHRAGRRLGKQRQMKQGKDAQVNFPRAVSAGISRIHPWKGSCTF